MFGEGGGGEGGIGSLVFVCEEYVTGSLFYFLWFCKRIGGSCAFIVILYRSRPRSWPVADRARRGVVTPPFFISRAHLRFDEHFVGESIGRPSHPSSSRVCRYFPTSVRHHLHLPFRSLELFYPFGFLLGGARDRHHVFWRWL